MIGLLALLAAAVLGAVLGLPGRAIAALLAVVWLGILAIVATTEGVIGGSPGGWIVGGVIGALILGYRLGLGWLSRRARSVADETTLTPDPAAVPAVPDRMSDDELDRYARHIVLREIGGPGQMRLRAANVLLVGAGGLGAPIALYLAAAGVGRITVIDGDTVSLSNLQRQVIFRSDQQGALKADAAAANMAALNPNVAVTPVNRQIGDDDLSLVAAHDLVLDGTDNFDTRAMVNRLCAAAGVPLIAGAIAQWEGQVTLYDPARGGPCLTCLFPEPPAAGLAPPCAEAGVVGALPGVIGSIMAMEAIKQLTGAGQGLRGRLMIFDGLYGETRIIATQARAGCPVCGGKG